MLKRRAYSTSSSHWQHYIANYLKKHDYESYLSAPLYPSHLQNAYVALKAFSTELAMIQDTVSSPAIGQMRLQFWRDTVRNISTNPPPQQPLAIGLYAASKSPGISLTSFRYHLKRIIDARDAELHIPVHLTVDALTSHAEATSCTLLYLLLELVSPSTTTHSHDASQKLSSVPDASALAHAASHLGAAQTIAILLRALPFHAAHGRLSIPAEITAKHGLKQEDLFRSVARMQPNKRKDEEQSTPGLSDAVFEFATLANDHLITAQSVFNDSGRVPSHVMPVFAAAVPVDSFLKRLEAADFDIFHPKLQQRQWTLPWKMWRASSRSMF